MGLLEANQTLLGSIGAGVTSWRSTGPSYEFGELKQIFSAHMRGTLVPETHDVHGTGNIGWHTVSSSRREREIMSRLLRLPFAVRLVLYLNVDLPQHLSTPIHRMLYYISTLIF